ncbi:MAG: hypothetical protein JW829_15385, partial [Pirellulales bacterium]|nr:hypothetical protein [Pirellulales bacterium]
PCAANEPGRPTGARHLAGIARCPGFNDCAPLSKTRFLGVLKARDHPTSIVSLSCGSVNAVRRGHSDRWLTRGPLDS